MAGQRKIPLPNNLLFLLQEIWAHRQDWYFGADMGI